MAYSMVVAHNPNMQVELLEHRMLMDSLVDKMQEVALQNSMDKAKGDLEYIAIEDGNLQLFYPPIHWCQCGLSSLMKLKL
jgi:hypothetical protein